MNIAKSTVVAALRSRGLHDRANWVDRALPDSIDTAKNASLLDMLAIDVAELADELDDEPASEPSGAR